MSYIKLQSSDGAVFDLDIETAKSSETIKTMLDNLGTNENDVIPLAKVNAKILEKVIEWLKHNNAPAVPPDGDRNYANGIDNDTGGMSSWDKEFLRVDREVIFELIHAANYLDIKGLLDITCYAVASIIKGKSTEELRNTFNITNDFTPEEEAMINENEWFESE